jgi:peptidoglycan/xylan/chitin deacetylase (PgdA/CDA1 family)
MSETVENPALVSLTFGDGLRCQFERAVPLLDRYGFLATFFLTANTDPIHIDGGRHPDWRKVDWRIEDIALLKNLVQQGHEIGAHSVHHLYPFLDTNPKGEAEGSKHWIESRLGLEVVSYCYPFYHFTDPIKKAVMNAAYTRRSRGDSDDVFGCRDFDYQAGGFTGSRAVALEFSDRPQTEQRRTTEPLSPEPRAGQI